MNPIYKQGGGRGRGYGLDTFLERFDSICEEHQRSGRAKAFAFIFYDSLDVDLKKILKNEGVFTKLDRLSGRNLSIFYLHAGTRHSVELFNIEFLSKLNVPTDVIPPCVVFFKLSEKGLGDISVAQLDSADIIHGFHELYSVIQNYLHSAPKGTSTDSRSLRWFKSGSNFVGLEAFRALLKAALEQFL